MNPGDVRERTVAVPAGGPPVPSDLAALLEQPVPTRLLDGAYTAFDELTFDAERGVWRLGTAARGGSIALMSSGEVRCRYPAGDVFVSSTFAKFNETVRAVAARYPFYDVASFDDEAHMARLHEDLFDAVSAVDLRAADEGWWNDLLWEILSGDYGVEAFE